MKAIERDSNYVHPHGAYIEDWRSPSGLHIWTIVAPLHQNAVHALLATAFVAQENDPHTGLRDLLPMNGDYGHWLRVGNKNFVIYHVDYQKVYAITNRDGNYYLISAKLKEVEAFTKGRHYSEMYPRMKEALYNLHYDLNVTRDILL